MYIILKQIKRLTKRQLDEEIKGQLFYIKFVDNDEIIQAWFEEIYKDSCTVDGVLI